MSLVYRVMYRIGFTPWDTGTVAAELGTLVEGDGALPAGRALGGGLSIDFFKADVTALPSLGLSPGWTRPRSSPASTAGS